MRKLSHWASIHRRTAIALIVGIDIVKALAGIYLGYRFFPALPSLISELLVIGIIMAVLLIETQFKRQTAVPFLTKTRRYQLRTRSTFCLFMGSFLLSILLGNRYQQVAIPQIGDFTAQASVVRLDLPFYESDGVDKLDDSQKIRPLTRKELRKERRLAHKNRPQRPMHEKTAAYVLLFFLGLALAYLGAGLSCSLSCSNQGVAATIVALLALGALVGGIYFLVKAIVKPKLKSTVPRN